MFVEHSQLAGRGSHWPDVFGRGHGLFSRCHTRSPARLAPVLEIHFVAPNRLCPRSDNGYAFSFVLAHAFLAD